MLGLVPDSPNALAFHVSLLTPNKDSSEEVQASLIMAAIKSFDLSAFVDDQGECDIILRIADAVQLEGGSKFWAIPALVAFEISSEDLDKILDLTSKQLASVSACLHATSELGSIAGDTVH
jgi:hypothetical protein